MPDPIDLAFPFTGSWLTQNSPANRVPSHGTARFATANAIDFVPVDERGRTAPLRLGSWLRPEPPERFPGFGRAIYAPVSGVVVTAHDSQPDHDAHRGLPSVSYALTQGRRAAGGWEELAGNYVFIDTGRAIVVLCHLQRGSVSVRSGMEVRAGALLGRCGNSGNSTEPHVHVQAMDATDARRARPLAITFDGSLPRNGEIVVVSPWGRTGAGG